jgi:molybdenum cofactor cytidylyltransferase
MPASDQSATPPIVLLLAAGEGRRYGDLKQLARIEGEPMVRRVARTAIATGVPVVVVTGAQAERVELAVADLPLRFVRHAGWQQGMGGSLAAGIGHLRTHHPRASGVLLCLADQPLVDADLLGRMLQRHRAAPDRLLATRSAAASGPPVLFPRDCLEDLATWSGARGAHRMLEQQAARVEWFESSLAGDVDTPEDLRHAREWLEAQRRSRPD